MASVWKIAINHVIWQPKEFTIVCNLIKKMSGEVIPTCQFRTSIFSQVFFFALFRIDSSLISSRFKGWITEEFFECITLCLLCRYCHKNAHIGNWPGSSTTFLSTLRFSKEIKLSRRNIDMSLFLKLNCLLTHFPRNSF